MGNVPILSICDLSLVKRILITDFHVFNDRSKRIVSNGAFVIQAIWGEVDFDASRSILSPAHTGSKLRQIYPTVDTRLQALDTHLSALMGTDRAVVDVARLWRAFTCDVYPACGLSLDTRPYDAPENTLAAHVRRFVQIDIRKDLVSLALPPFAAKWPKISDYRVMAYLIEMYREYLIKRRRGNMSKRKYLDFLELTTGNMGEHDLGNYADKVSDGDTSMPVNTNMIDHVAAISKPVYTDTELLALSFAFSTGGITSTACALTACVYELALNPAIQSRLYREIVGTDNDMSYEACERLPYLDAVVSETLRLHTPNVRLLRIASADYDLGDTGITIPAGQHIEIPLYAIHHSAEYYSEPYTFNPDRFMPENASTLVPYAYLPFGA
ncbi:unnamed protein product, partial [Oppiella nova]